MKLTVHLFVKQDLWQSKPNFLVSSLDMQSFGHELISSKEIEFDEPENFSMQQFQLRKLAKEKEAAIEAFHKKIAQIDDQIKKF